VSVSIILFDGNIHIVNYYRVPNATKYKKINARRCTCDQSRCCCSVVSCELAPSPDVQLVST